MRNSKLDVIRKEVHSDLSELLESVGIMFRLFSRVKSKDSIDRKLKMDERYGISKKIQDLLGLRVVLYFNEDISNARSIISRKYKEKSNDLSIDQVSTEEFRAVRYNIVYSLTEPQIDALDLKDYTRFIDTTFELQIRTIFSEGWHEVEHDLRYKSKDDWIGNEAESRLLNGVLAALESSEWTMIKIFDELAYKHYKSKSWTPMLRQKLRLRFSDERLSDEIIFILDNDADLAKKIYRTDRELLIRKMSEREYSYVVVNYFRTTL